MQMIGCRKWEDRDIKGLDKWGEIGVFSVCNDERVCEINTISVELLLWSLKLSNLTTFPNGNDNKQ